MTDATDAVTARDAARIYGKSVSTIYRLAHYYGWRRISHEGRVYYNRGEVDASLGK